MGIRSSIYKAIRDRLKDSIPGLAYIDLQKGQFKNKTQNYPVPLPSILVEFKSTRWHDTSGEQIGDSVISLHYYVDIVTDSFDTAEQESETIEILDSLDQLYKTMQGFSGEKFNPLDRTDDSTDDYGERFIHFRADFKTAIFEQNPETPTTQKPKIKFKF